MRVATVLVMLATACTRHVALGEQCENAEQCGKGSDCYRGVCTPLCADDSECDGQLVCARHRCLMATGEPRRAEDRTPTADNRLPTTEDRPPPPEDRKADPSRPGLRDPAPQDPVDVAKELRSIHEELDSLRKEQNRQNDAIEALRKHH